MIMNCHGSHSAKVTLMDGPVACREAVGTSAEGLFKSKLIMGGLEESLSLPVSARPSIGKPLLLLLSTK